MFYIKKKYIHAVNRLPELPSTIEKHTFDICWHFAISMNYKLKISAGKVFLSNLRNVLLLLKKKAVNYNFYFFICLFVNLWRKFTRKFRSIIFVTDLQWKAKRGFVASKRTPTLQPWTATSLARYLYFWIHKNCLIAECQPSLSYGACNSRLFPAFTANIALFRPCFSNAEWRKKYLKQEEQAIAATVNLLAIDKLPCKTIYGSLIDHRNLSPPTAEKRLIECGVDLTSANVRKYIRYPFLWPKKSNVQYSSTSLFIIFFTPLTNATS